MNEEQTIASDLPVLAAGSQGTEGVWADIDRAYDVDHLHNMRASRLHQRNASFAAQQFQSQMLALALLTEGKMPLVTGGHVADPTKLP